MQIAVKQVRSIKEKKHAISIRRKVFVEEMNIPENIEIDKHDESAKHILAYIENKPIGTARWRKTSHGLKLERFAVLKEYRSRGAGKALTKYIIKKINKEKMIFLNSQYSAIGFYEKLGFKKIGNIFIEVDIPHQKMFYNI